MKLRAKMKATDPNVIAKSIVDAATAEEKNPAAVALGKLGGLKGGKARIAKLSPEQIKESARKAAQVRWSKK
jgi:hypothetical protein